MSTVYFESDEELFSQDLNSTGDPEYRPPQYFRTGRHSSFINFAIFHLKCAGFDLGSSPEMEEGCEMLNDESFEKHVSQGEHEGNLEAAGDGFESDEETSCVAMPGKNLIPFSEQSITDVKLDQIKNKKLKNAIAAARASI